MYTNWARPLTLKIFFNSEHDARYHASSACRHRLRVLLQCSWASSRILFRVLLRALRPQHRALAPLSRPQEEEEEVGRQRPRLMFRPRLIACRQLRC